MLDRFISYKILETLNTAARKMITEKSATIDTYLTNILKLHFIVYCWHLDTIVLTHMPLIYWSIMIIGVFSNFDWGKIQPSWLMSSTHPLLGNWVEIEPPSLACWYWQLKTGVSNSFFALCSNLLKVVCGNSLFPITCLQSYSNSSDFFFYSFNWYIDK